MIINDVVLFQYSLSIIIFLNSPKSKEQTMFLQSNSEQTMPAL